MAKDKQPRPLLLELEGTDRKLRSLSSTLEALVEGYATNHIADGRMTSEIFEGLKDTVENIRAQLDEVGQAAMQETME